MIRSIVFPEKATAEIRDQLNAAGEGATLRIIPRATQDGTAIEFFIGIRRAASEKPIPDLLFCEVECDGEPTDSSHVCPGPLCP